VVGFGTGLRDVSNAFIGFVAGVDTAVSGDGCGCDRDTGGVVRNSSPTKIVKGGSISLNRASVL